MQSSTEPLSAHHDVALLDLDGVVYVGPDAVPGAAEALDRAVRAGMRLGFVTNNAARRPEQVAEHLRELGIRADPSDVITSAQASARVLAERLPAGADVLIIGTEALADAVSQVGLHPVSDADGGPAAVVQGYSPDVSWRMLAEACAAIRTGAWFVASNTDLTLPSPRGPMPGNGSFVGIVSRTTGVAPTVAGKPEPAMHAECVERTGAVRPLVVGDRLDTDIEGAVRVGVPSLLVLSGLTGAPDLLVAGKHERPTYLAADVDGLNRPAAAIEVSGDRASCGDWTAHSDGTALTLSTRASSGSGRAEPTVEDDGLDALRVLAELAWATGCTEVRGDDGSARSTLRRLGLPVGPVDPEPPGPGS